MALKAQNIHINLTSDTCNAEENAKTCAQRLLKPSCETFYSLKQWLSCSSVAWLREFIRYQGLTRLIETLALLSQDRQTEEWTSISDAILQLDCMGCIREVLNHREGLEYMLQHPGLIDKLVLALDTPNTYPKKQMFEVLACLTMVTTEGHSSVLRALDTYKRVKHQAHRFTVVLHELKLADNAHYRHTLITFINALVSGQPHLPARCRVRNQLIGLRLLDVLNFLKKDELDPQLCVQIKTFYELKSRDEVELSRTHSFQYNDPSALFEAINNKTTGRIESANFLHILQDLYSLDNNSKIPTKLWTTLERITNQIVSLQTECDTEIFIENLNDFIKNPSNRTTSTQAASAKSNCDMDIKQDLSNRYKLTSDCLTDEKLKIGTEMGTESTAVDIPVFDSEVNKFSEVDEALKAILQTTESLRLENKDLEKDERRDSGISMKSNISSPLYSRQNSQDTNSSRDLGNEVKVTARVSTSGSSRIVKLPSIDENRAERDSVFEKAARVQRSHRVDLMKCSSSQAEEPVKLQKTKFATLVPVSQDTEKLKEGSTLFGRPYTESAKCFRLDYQALETDFKFDLQKKLQDPEYEVQLLSDETSLVLNVLLARLETTAEYLAACIRQSGTEDLDIQATRRLLEALPSQQQVDLIVQYTGHSSMYDLGQPEQLMVHLASIPDYRLKLRAGVFRADFNKKFFELRAAFESMVTACRGLLHSQRLPRFVRAVTDAVNFLNRGSHVTAMGGACLDSWCSLADTIDSTGHSLLHHIAKQMYARDKDLLHFYEDFTTLEKAASYSVESLKQEVTELNVQLKKFIDTLQLGQISTRKTYEAMLATIKGNLQHLQEQIGALRTLSHQLAAYFCVPEQGFDLQRFFAHLLKFVTLVKNQCKEEEQQRCVKRLADTRLRALGASNAEQYFAHMFAQSGKPEEAKSMKRLNLIDVILEQLHQGKVEPNFLGQPTTVDETKPTHEAVKKCTSTRGDQNTNPENKKDRNAKAENKDLNISEMFDFLEENIASPVKEGEAKEDGLSNCTYHVVSPRAVTLSRSKPLTTSCEPAHAQAEDKETSGVYENKIVAIDTTGAFDVRNKEEKQEVDILAHMLQIDDKYKVENEANFEKEKDEAAKEAQQVEDIMQGFLGDKITPEKELSWDGFLPMQYTPGKDIYLPIQSTPAKEGESILVIPDLRPDGKRTFADKADLFIMGQYRKTHQISSSSFAKADKLKIERKEPFRNKTGTNPNILKVLDIAEDKSIELEAKVYDRTEATPYDNVMVRAEKHEQEEARPEVPVPVEKKNIVECEVARTTDWNKPSKQENKENDNPDVKKPKAKQASKLGILKRFSKAVLRQKEPSVEKSENETETKSTDNHKNSGVVVKGDTYKHKNSAAVMRGERLLVDPVKDKPKPKRAQSDKTSNHSKQSVQDVGMKYSSVPEQGIVTMNLYTRHTIAASTKLQPAGSASTKPDNEEELFKRPQSKPFQRQNALPVRTKIGQNPVLKRVGPRSTLPQSKKEEKLKLGSYKDKDTIIKPSYREISQEPSAPPIRPARPRSLQLKSNALRPSQQLNIQRDENNMRPGTFTRDKSRTLKAPGYSTSENQPQSRNVHEAKVQTINDETKQNTTSNIRAPTTKGVSENKGTNCTGQSRFGFTKPRPKLPTVNKGLGGTEIESARACSVKIYKKY